MNEEVVVQIRPLPLKCINFPHSLRTQTSLHNLTFDSPQHSTTKVKINRLKVYMFGRPLKMTSFYQICGVQLSKILKNDTNQLGNTY